MRFVLATFGSHGDVNPYLTIARALRARGHEVALATHAHYRPLVEGAGFALHAVRPDYDEAWGPAAMHPRRGSEVLIRQLFMPPVRESYHDLCAALRGADALLSHPITFAAPLAAATTGVAWASGVLAPVSFFSLAGAPGEMPLLAPELAALRRAWPAGYRAFLRAGRRVTRSWTRPVAALRAELGLAPGAHPVFEGQHAPALVLALFSPLLAAPQPDWPAQTLVTGALADDAVHAAAFGPAAGGGDGALPAALARFLDDGPAPIAVTLGTSAVLTGDAPRVYREALAAAGAVGARVVLLTGRDARNVPPGPLPAWACAVPAASHAALFPRAAAVVHQGGMGTLTQALRSGRPMLVVPFAHDQPDNADRAARLGLARVLPPRRFRAPHAAGALAALLGDASLRARAAEVGALVRAEDGAGVAAAALERLAAAHRRPATPGR
jgi:UDP:flavonoid glycosyltransferase YjiC (YdhE family)